MFLVNAHIGDVAKNLRLPPVEPTTDPIPHPSTAAEEVKEVHMQDKPIPSPVMDDDVDGIDNASPHKTITITSKATRNAEKLQELEAQLELPEGELQDATAVEIGLYSIVPEHVSSAQKMHRPDRRLARLYIHSVKILLKERWAKPAKSILSTLDLVARSCRNDVPRYIIVVVQMFCKLITNQPLNFAINKALPNKPALILFCNKIKFNPRL
jgi:hypothetical protein